MPFFTDAFDFVCMHVAPSSVWQPASHHCPKEGTWLRSPSTQSSGPRCTNASIYPFCFTKLWWRPFLTPLKNHCSDCKPWSLEDAVPTQHSSKSWPMAHVSCASDWRQLCSRMFHLQGKAHLGLVWWKRVAGILHTEQHLRAQLSGSHQCWSQCFVRQHPICFSSSQSNTVGPVGAPPMEKTSEIRMAFCTLPRQPRTAAHSPEEQQIDFLCAALTACKLPQPAHATAPCLCPERVCEARANTGTLWHSHRANQAALLPTITRWDFSPILVPYRLSNAMQGSCCLMQGCAAVPRPCPGSTMLLPQCRTKRTSWRATSATSVRFQSPLRSLYFAILWSFTYK